MTAKDPKHPIDRLVRMHLDRETEELNTDQLLDRIFSDAVPTGASSAQAPPTNSNHNPSSSTGSRKQRGRRASWSRRAAAIAAGLLVVVTSFFVGRWETPVRAQPQDVVEQAILTHDGPVERCYVVRVHRGMPNGVRIPSPRDVQVWTRGDRFWVDVQQGKRQWTWGQSADESAWMVLGPHRSIKIQPDEQGKLLQHLCDVYRLELKSLLQGALRNAQLNFESENPFTYVVSATSTTARNKTTRSLRLVVDKETKAVRSLRLVRQYPNRPTQEIEFTLVDSRPANDALYEPEGHLDRPYRVLTRSGQQDRRSLLLKTWFGPGVQNWIRARQDREEESLGKD